MEGYLSIREAAEKWGVSERRINQYCTQGRIADAEQFGGTWAIPENAKNRRTRADGKNSWSYIKSRRSRSCFPTLCP
ncbi:helix-turn-helix domain-containing protein [uncultured Negativibacillus sp.]|uniref:helix-turn-helix domain-containing protein n=1 Tax=uncultured Negativibacillus sp. TaxID=1980696 RepID=UPI0025EC6695|nr:helix-turn-helix domain-containing protein [uncultured Negativibacillus sp.]